MSPQMDVFNSLLVEIIFPHKLIFLNGLPQLPTRHLIIMARAKARPGPLNGNILRCNDGSRVQVAVVDETLPGHFCGLEFTR